MSYVLLPIFADHESAFGVSYMRAYNYSATYLYRKLILTSMYEMPSSMEESKNARTYSSHTDIYLIMFYRPR